jgi:serine/threonine protein kinase/SpoVK/Ycf46/Vps4 family AAA+-type ATPase
MLKINQGDILGPFRIDRLLGAGAFKAVYKASPVDGPEGEWVALAIPHDQGMPERKAQVKEYEFARRLDHPGIVRMFDLHEVEGLFFVSMEYVEGFTLDKILAKRGVISPMEAAEYAIDAAEALKHAHDRNISHRDVKPGNILRTREGHIKLLDFGLARLGSKDVTQTARSVGTLQYVAPEVYEGSTGKKVDIWALGVMLHEMVLGEFPFKGNNMAQLMKAVCEGSFRRPSEEGAELPPAFERIILRCLEKEPARRYSMGQLLNALQAFRKEGLVVEGFEGKLELLLRARLPYIYIVSYEEDQVLSAVDQAAQTVSRGMEDRPVVTWSISQGLVNREGKPVAEKTHDPLAMLHILPKLPDHAVAVLKDFHRFFESPVIVREIKDLNAHLKKKGKAVILVAPVDAVPEELEKLIQVHDFPLPDRRGLERIFNTLVRENRIEDRLRLSGPERERLVAAALGLTHNEAEAAFARVVIEEKGALSMASTQKILDEKRQVLRRSETLEFFPTSEDFSQVGGLASLKEWFNSRSAAYHEEARSFGLPYPRGILLLGVPGCGKSLCAKAVASEWQAPLLKLDVGKLFASLVGRSERNLERALATAEAVAPCILWLDEIEKGFGGLDRDTTGVATRLFGHFITWLNEKKSPVFVVATANRVVARDAKGRLLPLLPAELMRKGRIDEIFFLDLPDADERREILRIHLAKVEQALSEDDLTVAAREMEGFSGAEMEYTVIAGLFAMFADVKTHLGLDHILMAAGEAVPLSRTRAADIALIQKWAADNARPAR